MFQVTPEAMSVVPIETILTTWRSGDADMWSCSLPELLDHKRKDEHYPKLVETLKKEGWTKGIKAVLWIGETTPTMTDGHHRLAAAIDLGQKYVPVETGYCEPDSGSWGRTRARGWF